MTTKPTKKSRRKAIRKAFRRKPKAKAADLREAVAEIRGRDTAPKKR